MDGYKYQTLIFILLKEINKMNLKNKLAVGAGFIGLGFGLFASSTRETDCETFRGYTNLANGYLAIVSFGSNPDRADFALEDARDESETRKLEIGKSYKIKIRNYLFGSERLISTKECAPDF